MHAPRENACSAPQPSTLSRLGWFRCPGGTRFGTTRAWKAQSKPVV